MYRPSSPSPAVLTSLPPELLLRIYQYFLDPLSISRIAQTCHLLNHIANSELIWKDLVLDLVDTFGVEVEESVPTFMHRNSPPVASYDHDTRGESTWREQAKFLLPNARHLGYFASSIPFSSRVVRVSIVIPPKHLNPSSTSSDDPPRYSIHAAQLRPYNKYTVTSPPPLHLLPFGANLEITLDAYSISRLQNPSHPDAGLSIDVLSPRYDFSASMFDIDSTRGAVLARPGPSSRRGQGEGVPVVALDPSSRNPSQQARLQLRLSLEPVIHLVHGESRRSEDPNANSELSREALLALFSGRLPQRFWPTLELVGLEEEEHTLSADSTQSGQGNGARRSRIRPNGVGAFRGLQEWVSERAIEQSIARIVNKGSNRDGVQVKGQDKAYVTGFRLRAKRVPSSDTSPTNPSTPTSTSSTSSSTPQPRTRRRGVGRDGGMAVLWQGREEDPEEVERVTILRAGDPEQGGVTLHLEGQRTRRTPSPNDDAARATGADSLADTLDASGEAFFPIKPPAKSIGWNDATCMSEGEEITATSLQGMWVGTYGSHGLEFVHLSTSFASPASPPVLSPASPTPDETLPAATSSNNRILTATKLTGDTNVPSGETTWIAFLDSPIPSPASSLDSVDVPVPSISKDKWDAMNQLDPITTDARYSSLDWSEGTTQGVGQIALSGFLQPGWTSAQVRFIRSKTKLRRNRVTRETVRVEKGQEMKGDVNEGDWQLKAVESVEEIQLRWAELNKIAVFKRVRI